MYEYDDEERGPGRTIAMIAGLLAVGALGWFVLLPAVAGDTAIAPLTTENTSLAIGSDVSDPDEGDTATTDSGVATDAAATESSVESADVTSTTLVASATPPPTSTEGTAVTTTSSVEAVAPADPPTGADTFPTLPDGSPVPVVAIFDRETITLSGFLPSEDAAQRLRTLAIANSKFPQAAIVSFIAIDPAVPANVGVRVIELNSVRFPEASAEILPEHGAEIDRVATIMNALENVTVLVIGHSDQRGSEETNYRISEDRAQAVVSHLVAAGIEPSRMSSRAVGESDLISLNNDEAALALNRRTEFVFYGLLIT